MAVGGDMAQLDIITLHRNAARDTLFPGPFQGPLFFDPTIKAWVVTAAREVRKAKARMAVTGE